MSLFLKPKNIVELLRPVLWLAKLNGLAPFTIKHTKKGMSVRASKSTLIYSYCALTIIHSVQLILLWITYKYEIMDLSNVVYRFLRTLLATSNCCSLLANYREIAELLRYQQALEYPLPSYFTAFPVITYTFLLGNTIINQGMVNSSVLSWALGCYVDSTSPPPILLLSFVYSCQIEVIHRAVQNLNKNVTKCVNDFKFSHPISLRSVMAQHYFLRNVCVKINDTFGWPMLITNGAVCYEVTWCLYCVWVADEAPGFLLCITWAMTYLVPAFCSMASCQRVQNALYRTKAISSELTLIKPALSWPMRQEVREWDIQLRQLPLQFHAKHFFILSGEQIRTVVSVILTYTIILIQNVRQTRTKSPTGMF